jgi:hypothetical protein
LQLTGVDLKENAEGAIEALPQQEA